MSDNPVPPSQQNKHLDADLQELKNYVHLKVAQEPATTAVDFETTAKACRCLLNSFVAKREAGDFSIHAIPDLLEVLRHAEMYRSRIIEQAEMALEVWQTYYKKESPKQALSESDAQAIGEIIDSDQRWRRIYRKILEKLVGLDLYCIFVSKNWSLSEFMVRLFEYSPSSFKSVQGYQPSPLRFVQFLDENEKQLLTRRCRKSLRQASDLHKWLQENYPDAITSELNFQDFEKIHHPPFKTSRIEGLMNLYIDYVASIYDTLTTILPNKTKDTNIA